MQCFFSMITRISKVAMLLVVMVIYLMTAGRFNELHEVLHTDQHNVTHFAKDESDGCHRAIYHHDKNGCSHKTHLTAFSRCQVCDFICNGEVVISTFTIDATDSPILAIQSGFFPSVSDKIHLRLSARAPPIC